MLKNMKIKEKLILITLIEVFLLSALLIVIGLYRMNTVATNVANTIYLDKLRGDLSSASKYVYRFYGHLTRVDSTLVDRHGNSINSHYHMVDAMKEDLNIEATIFVKYGIDFKRVATSIKDEDGKRIVGTMLGVDSEAYPDVSIGRTFIGTTVVNGNRYLVGYQPMLTASYEIIGMTSIAVPQTEIKKLINNDLAAAFGSLAVASVICLLLFGTLVYFTVTFLLAPIRKTTDMLKDLVEGEGDLTKRLEVVTNDEIGELISYFNKFLNKIRDIVTTIVENAKSLQAKSIELSTTAEKLIKNADDMGAKSLLVSASTEQLSFNTNMLDTVSEESSSNVTSVFTATDFLTSRLNHVVENTGHANLSIDSVMKGINELEAGIEETCQTVGLLVKDIGKIVDVSDMINESIYEVANNTQLAFNISSKANKEAQVINNNIQELKQSSKDIYKSLETIIDNANQANTLSLNAAIAVASAGEAGKAISAVLDEIKTLSKQSLVSSVETLAHYEKIDNSADFSHSSLENISKTIDKLSEITSNIVDSIKHQNSGTLEISQSSENISLNARAVKDKISKIHNSAKVISDFTNVVIESMREVTKTSADAVQTSTGIVNTSLQASKEVQKIQENTQEIKQFVEEVANNISEMIPQIESTTAYAKSTKRASDDLYKIAEELNTKVILYKI